MLSLVLLVTDIWHTDGTWGYHWVLVHPRPCEEGIIDHLNIYDQEHNELLYLIETGLIVIFSSCLCSFWLKPWMIMFVCLRWSRVKTTTTRSCSGIILTIDPLLTITRVMGLCSNIPEMKIGGLLAYDNMAKYALDISIFFLVRKEMLAKHASLSGRLISSW